MRPVLYILSFLALIALGFWAYRENYATQASLREVRGLQSQIADLREALSVQRAEWAYLNRPQRLRELVDLNFDSLGLLPMDPTQFGTAAQVAFPVPEIPAITGPIDTQGTIGAVEDTAAAQAESVAQAPAAPASEEGL
ncbi:cell division protein FtsL [Neotabrizicola sp. sgz301269]|uniref:cell division protein FtsL n=1 Tax=Neotabrizicola sp. sgz301269 TaxID=3276282 RepID=UPI0037705AA9